MGAVGDDGPAGVQGQPRVVGTPSWALHSSVPRSAKGVSMPMLRGFVRPRQQQQRQRQHEERRAALEQMRVQEEQQQEEAIGYAEERPLLRSFSPRGQEEEFMLEPVAARREPEYFLVADN